MTTSEDASTAAYWRSESPISLWNLDSRKKLREIPVDGKIEMLVLSGGGMKLAITVKGKGGADKKLAVYETLGGKQLLELRMRTPSVPTSRPIAFSPDGNVVAYPYADPSTPQTRRIRIADKTELPAFPGLPDQLAYSPDGTRLVYTTDEGVLFVCDMETNQVVKRIRLPSRLPEAARTGLGRTSITFASDSRHVLIGNANGTIFIFRLESLSKPW